MDNREAFERILCEQEELCSLIEQVKNKAEEIGKLTQNFAESNQSETRVVYDGDIYSLAFDRLLLDTEPFSQPVKIGKILTL